jgi:hypothetical protein
MIHAVNILMATAATALASATVWFTAPAVDPAHSATSIPFVQSPVLQSENAENQDAAQTPRGELAQQDDKRAPAPGADDGVRRDRMPNHRIGPDHRARPAPRSQGDGRAGHADSAIEPLSPHQIEQAIDILCQLDRERCEKLQDRRCEDPDEFDEQFARHGWRLLALSRLQQSNPDLFNLKVRELRLDSQIDTTADLYRQAVAQGGREAAALEMQLKDLLRTQMELRLQVRGQQLIVLEQHVVAARDRLAEDARAFAETADQMIVRRLEALKQRPARHDGTDSIEPATEGDPVDGTGEESPPVFGTPK